MRWLPALAAVCSTVFAQEPPNQPALSPAAEQQELGRGYSEANHSPVEMLRFIDKYLERHPQSAYRPQLAHDATLAAASLHDDAAVIRWGELSLALTPVDVKVLTAVTRSLLASNAAEAAERALKYARRSEELARQYQKENPANISPAEWRNQTDQALAEALTDDARATGILGHPDQALATAQRAFDTFPNAGAAREIAYWLERSGKTMDAVRALAEAFTIPDAQSAAADRARDRQHMAELYRQANGSEDHLGDVVLAAYDRNVIRLKNREQGLLQNEPNSGLIDPMTFTLSALDGEKLPMAGLRGKVVVLDVWATYCVPCREQHPLYEKVKERFRDNPSVVFLSIDADPDHAPVKPFLAAQGWKGPVYFEDGLVRLFAVDSLPATVLLDRRGKLYTRLNGYAMDHFVDLLTERIQDALAVPVN